jgi:hypothetical protein
VVIELDAADAAPTPTVFVAVAVNVYEVDADNPVTVIGEDAPVAVTLPGLDVTVYVVIVLPLLLTGAVNVTLAFAPTSVAVPIVGAFGTAGVLKYGPVLAVLVPMALVAVSVTE